MRKQAKKEIMKLADTRRSLVINEFYQSPAPIGLNDPVTETFIVNAFGFLPSASTTFTDGEIIDPLLVQRITVLVDWHLWRPGGTIGTPALPTLQFDVALIAVNDQIPNTVTPRLTSIAEDNTLFVRHPSSLMRYQFNAENVTVIKRKRLRFSPRGVEQVPTSTVPAGQAGAQSETRNMKIVARLKGTKEFESLITNATPPVETITAYLKGWNYYWVYITQSNQGTSLGALTTLPYGFGGDRYMYYKDF